ncbi:MAG: hypothetical protein ACTHOJ_02740, partial [Sphingomonas oligoaromativorans]
MSHIVDIPAEADVTDPPLSPWWVRTVLIVMMIGFAGLIGVTMLSYRNAPPTPAQVVDDRGRLLFT